jgi:hypothetical protein
MAHPLEKSGRHRVLRRLVPRDVYYADQQIKVGIFLTWKRQGWT